MLGEPSSPVGGSPRLLPELKRDQLSDEEEQHDNTSNSPSSATSDDVAAFLPMSLFREVLRKELEVFADTRLKWLLTTELDKHAPARDSRLRSAAVDTGPGQSVSAIFSAEFLQELRPNSVPELSITRRPSMDVLSGVSGQRVTSAWPSEVTPEMGAADNMFIGVETLARARETCMERVVFESSRRINRLSDDVDRFCSFPLVERFEGSAFFSFVTGLVILSNTFVMALAAENEVHHIEDPHNQTYKTLELVFVIIYTVEWLIRVWSGRCRFIRTSWCWFDFGIILGGWIEVGGGSSYVTQFRIMRTLKMLKVMRVVRLMRSFREVRVLVDSLMGSVRPLVWASVLITGIIFMFAILFVNTIASYLTEQFDAGYPDIDTLERTSLLDSWGSVPKSMYTLFSCVSGGEDWRAPASLLQKVGSEALAYFLTFVVFFVFAITNSVCAFFVEAASHYTNCDQYAVQQERMSRKKKYVDSMASILRDCVDGRGYITQVDFKAMMRDPRMDRFAAELDIDSLDLSNFFDRLSAHGQQAVEVDRFVEGCIRMCGQARSMDMNELLTQTETLFTEMRKIRIALDGGGKPRLSRRNSTADLWRSENLLH